MTCFTLNIFYLFSYIDKYLLYYVSAPTLRIKKNQNRVYTFSKWKQGATYLSFTVIIFKTYYYKPVCIVQVPSKPTWEAITNFFDASITHKRTSEDFINIGTKLVKDCPSDSTFHTRGLRDILINSIDNVKSSVLREHFKRSKIKNIWLQIIVLVSLQEQTSKDKEINLREFKKLHKCEPKLVV